MFVLTHSLHSGRVRIKGVHAGGFPLSAGRYVIDVRFVIATQDLSLVRGKDLIITNPECLDVRATELEKIRLDPLLELGRQRSCIQFCNVDYIFRRDTNESLFFVPINIFSNDDVGEHLSLFISHLNEHPDTITPLVFFLFVWRNHAKQRLVFTFLAGDIECFQSNEKRSSVSHLL